MSDIRIPRPIVERRLRLDRRDYVPLLLGIGLFVLSVFATGEAMRTRRTQAAPRLSAEVTGWTYVRDDSGDVASTRLRVRVRDAAGREFQRGAHAHGEITGLAEGARTAVRADPRDPSYVELDGHPLEPPATAPAMAVASLAIVAVGVWHLTHLPLDGDIGRDVGLVLATVLPLLLVALVVDGGLPDRYPLPPPPGGR